ncbi:MAG: hypothetical protein ACUVTD_09435, partial [Nitrososphaerales archaeon]
MGLGMLFSPSALPTHDFISKMSESLQQRLVKAGWNVERTVFFVIPYIAKSPVNSGIIRDYKHKVYYRTLIATKGVLEYLSDKELKIIVDHEMEEIRWAEDRARTGLSRITTSEEEQRRHELELLRLYDKYGENRVKRALKRVYS